MKTCFSVCIIVLLLAAAGLAQPPDTLWTRVLGGPDLDEAMTVCQTVDGSYLAAGYTRPNASTQFLLFIVKLDGLGDTLWLRTYGGPSYEIARGLCPTQDGGALVVGTTQSYGAGQADLYALRLNTAGDTLWTRTYGTPRNDQTYGVLPVGDGYLLAGYATVSTEVSAQMYVVRISATGDTLWTRAYGGTGLEGAAAIQEVPGGGYVLAGYTESYGAGGRDAWVVRISAVGDTIWTRALGGPFFDEATGIACTADGGFLVGGSTESPPASGRDFYLVKLDGFGVVQWTRLYGTTQFEQCYSLTATTDGSFVMGGKANRPDRGADAWLVKVEADGDTIWTKTMGGTQDDGIYAMDITGDGGYICSGFTRSYGAGQQDVYLMRIPGHSGITGIVRESNTGTPLPAVTVSAVGEAARTTSDAQGHYTLTLMPGVHTIVTSGPCVSIDTVLRDVTVQEDSIHYYDLLSSAPQATITQTSINLLAWNHVTAADSLYIYNSGTGPLHFAITSGVYAPQGPWLVIDPMEGNVQPGDSFAVAVSIVPDTTDDGVYDYFGWLVVHMNSCPDSVQHVVVTATVLDAGDPAGALLPDRYGLESYPNPFNAQAVLRYALPREGAITLTVYDVMGRQVAELARGVHPAGVHRVVWDASGFGSGVYFARLQTPEATLSRKLLLLK